MTAFIVGVSMMVIPVVGMYMMISKANAQQNLRSADDSSQANPDLTDAGVVLILSFIVAIIFIYFGYGIMDKAVVDMGWWANPN